jgi:hypothetical protein
MANIIKRTKTLTVLVKDTATKEDLLEVKRLVELGWVSKPCKPKVEKKEVEHIVTESFDISFDEVRKIDMVKYIKEFVKEEDALKKFSIAAHKKKNGEPSVNKEGKPKYNQLAAKYYFFQTFFPDKWVEIEKMLNERQFKSKKAKEENAIDKELKALLNS